MKKILILLVLPFLIGAGCNKQPNSNPALIDSPIVTNFEECLAAGNPAMESHPRQCNHKGQHFVEELGPQFDQRTYSHSGELEDVSGGKSTGTASALFTDSSVVLYAEFENLPLLANGYFYEGWLVRQEPFDFVSTGATVAELEEGSHHNNFTSSQNLDGYDFYVLTLEPDDGDPAPAEHIIEGKMKKL